MHPVLVDLGGGRTLGSYGLCFALALAVAGAGAVRAASRARMDVGLTIAAVACVVAGGLAGSWLAFVAVELARTGRWQAGGVVFFGAVPGGVLAAMAAGRALRLEWLRVLDLAIPSLAAAHALGRIGCFLGGCCYGRPFDGAWAVVYTHALAPAAHPSVPRHPTPLYEALGLLAIGLAFALRPARRPGDGARALAYLAAYAVLRIATESVRGDAVRGVWWGASTSQLAAAAALIAAGVLFARVRRRARLAEEGGPE